jgi:hypothetical protein
VLVAALLDQHVQHLALIVDRAPQPHAPPADLHHHLVQAPPTGRRAPASTQVGGEERAELDRPAADSFPADVDPAFGEQFLDVPHAQREPEIQPHRLADGGNRWRLKDMGDCAPVWLEFTRV